METLKCVRDHMNCIFSKYMLDTMIVYELALVIFALQFQDWIVALN